MTSSPQVTLSLHDNFVSSFLLTKDSCGRVENPRALEAEDRVTHASLTCWRSGIWKGTEFLLSPTGKTLPHPRFGFKVNKTCFKQPGW